MSDKNFTSIEELYAELIDAKCELKNITLNILTDDRIDSSIRQEYCQKFLNWEKKFSDFN